LKIIRAEKKTQRSSSKTVQDLTLILAAGATGMIILTHILKPLESASTVSKKEYADVGFALLK
jgi:hypothetical protein